MIDHAGLSYVQIDAGRIGGISVARQVTEYAEGRGVQFVNHTFTSRLALSASLQPFAGLRRHELCEYPVEASSLALDATQEHLALDEEGWISIPDGPGLGVTVNVERLRPYLVETEIRVRGRVLYRTPDLEG
jgi:L-alanine-DL-glutamate epimerase-like enolase superfamily enzyme